MKRNLSPRKVGMISTFPPLKYSAKIPLRNFSAHAFRQNTPLLPKNSAWCKMSFTEAPVPPVPELVSLRKNTPVKVL